MGITDRFNVLMAKRNQRITAKTNERALKLKAKRIREENKAKAIESYNSELNKLNKAKSVKKKSLFKEKAAELRKKNAARFSETKPSFLSSGNDNTPYWLKGGGNSGSSMFGQSSQPYWLKSGGRENKPKKKKSRGKSIIIKL